MSHDGSCWIPQPSHQTWHNSIDAPTSLKMPPNPASHSRLVGRYTYPILELMKLFSSCTSVYRITSHQPTSTDQPPPSSTLHVKKDVNFQDTVEMRYLKRLCCSGGNQSSTTSCLSSAKDRILGSWIVPFHGLSKSSSHSVGNPIKWLVCEVNTSLLLTNLYLYLNDKQQDFFVHGFCFILDATSFLKGKRTCKVS